MRPSEIISMRSGASELGQKPQISLAEIRQLAKRVEIVSIHPEALALLAPTSGNMEHVEAVRRNNRKIAQGSPDAIGKTPQNEFLILKLPEDASLKEIGEIADMVHTLRNKSQYVTRAKISGLSEKGYMVVPERDVVEAIKRLVPERIVTAEQTGSKIAI